MLTNVVLCIPVFALLLVIAAFMKISSVYPEALLIGLISWPWAARALESSDVLADLQGVRQSGATER